MGLKASSDTALYGYVPTEWVCIVFVVVFSLTTIVHLAQAMRYRLTWLALTIVPGGLLEILGWSGRLWNAINPRPLDGYLMQICCLILAPALIMASNYLILGLIINKLGIQYSRIAPKWYTVIFCSGDIISLIVQAIGGASAAIAVQDTSLPRKDPEKGAKIMVGGIIFQMFVMVLFTALGAEFLFRWATNRPFVRTISSEGSSDQVDESPGSALKQSPEKTASSEEAEVERWRLLLIGLAGSTLLIFIRSIYRTIELLDGWSGPIISNQQLFNCLDGMMIALALILVNFLHPGLLLRTRTNAVSLGMRKKKSSV
ncbi:RTA-like protein [Phaffia rhodozyma]|uniref:RTA-like protein n=1 Tax=Phaffia rhodozyma TaxID=264483 RepID=A0A0F7SMH4_PHARH|nr:RTA-like protein [Phaffia rhodozyma]